MNLQTLSPKPCDSSAADSVFPGITIAYINAHVDKIHYAQESSHVKSTFEILHCREGRIQCSISGKYLYLSPGDLLLVKTESMDPELSFPLRHCHGILIRIDVLAAPKCLSCLLQDVRVSPGYIAEKFCEEKGYFIARSNSSVEHIFSELYRVPEQIRRGYSKIKILELMLFLSVLEKEEDRAKICSPAQASLAKSVAEYLSGNMEEKLTLEQAAQKFHTSQTNIKSAFRAVYGIPFYSFAKAQKMESAAYMLEHTDKSITEIANEHGYDNSGKFSSAFRTIKGVTPSCYRGTCKSIHALEQIHHKKEESGNVTQPNKGRLLKGNPHSFQNQERTWLRSGR